MVDNPFALRESEQIENDSVFLKLFGTGMLDMLTDENFMGKSTIILSAPGGGKTSLMRIFTPPALSNIYSNRNKDDDYKELYHRLEQLGVVSEGVGPIMLGIYLPCSSNYSELEDLDLSQPDKNKLFLSLLNARLLSAALSGLLYLENMKFSDLGKITITKTPDSSEQSAFDSPINGKELYDYASKIEASICKKIDSFDFENESDHARIGDLEYFFKLHPNNIKIDGKQMITRTLVMLDDVHILTKSQRQLLFTKLQQQRPSIPVWIAERKEALRFAELLLGEPDRDFQIVEIERFFRDRSKKYDSFVLNVADRRARASSIELNSFSQCIDDSIDNQEWEQKLMETISSIRRRIEKKVSNTKAYDEWILQQENQTGTPREKAIGWKMLEIRIQRHSAGGQQMLIDTPLEIGDLGGIETRLKGAAEFLLSDEFKIPYYFGLERLSVLSTYNVQQYIGVANELFENVIARSIMRKMPAVDPQTQHDLVEKIAREYASSIPRRVPFGTYAFNILQSIGQYARQETLRATAPYPPGVTGIGLTSRFYNRIIDPLEQERKPEYKILENVLHSCLANNLLVADFDYKQGPKSGDTNVVFYLNRLLCVHFKLPLGYGGWRKTNPDEMCQWMGVVKIAKK